MNFKQSIFIVLLIAFVFILTGCGETVQGVRKDATRIGKGIRTIFVRESTE